ncbi:MULTISPECIES: hypothetical protein [Agrobacterium]|uniref:hypothetical protein n=1 Tax=Agrobacterium TaxID=357 RepID=UPI00035F81DA|nr:MULTISPECIES: hypothetical protein [Agrobacterium]EPR21205.1 hypothetical protein L902_01645 [Agrobacterium radiobacter DSM 30147]KDR89829.1 hypothetical protein K538_02405 [Agrobacterium tumefaciens GW4]KVK49856.1 hypothetical protein L903_18455 [Agrobacterium sp. JL28]KVK50148.1 hypothetical protein L904_18455 [Agrobacterium sp. LY4]
MTKIDIGLRQARKLTNLPHDERTAFISEGLPMLLESARGLYAASQTVSHMPRESAVLKGHAEEEAAKILILMDIVRCPKKLVAGRIGTLMGWYYDHLARLLYAEACRWRPINLKELRTIIDRRRVTHYLEGGMGEYIVPNDLIYRRETSLYADIEALDDGIFQWIAPSGYTSLFDAAPDALVVAEALSAFGAFSVKGLNAVSTVWNEMDFQDDTSCHENDRLIQATLQRLIDEQLASEAANEDHVQSLYGRWQMPLYALEMRAKEVDRSILVAEQENMLWAEMGVSYEY